MKIVMLMSVFGERAVGGAERTAAQMAKQLALRGHSVQILSLSPKGEPTPAPLHIERVICESIPLIQYYDPYKAENANRSARIPLPFIRLWRAIRKAAWHLRDIYNPAMVSAVRQKLVQIKPDILFTHTLQGFSVGVWGVARSMGIKVVHMTHDHALICPGTAMTRGCHVCERVCTSCSFFSGTRRMIAVSPNAIIGPSQVILERHKRFGWFRDVTLQQAISNALPTNWQYVNETALRRLSHYSQDQPMILGFLGRLDETKGADTLITALALLPESLLGRWRLLVGGQGSLNQLKEWVSSMSNGVHRWEHISPYIECFGLVKADDFLQKLDILVTPSRAHETFCNVVMEAASLGRPSIVSDKGALPERVTNGTSGWIFPAGNPTALSIQIARLIERPEEVSEKAMAAFKTKSLYTPHIQTDHIEQFLEKVINA